MFSSVFKGAPLGNQNAAGKRKASSLEARQAQMAKIRTSGTSSRVVAAVHSRQENALARAKNLTKKSDFNWLGIGKP